MGENLRMAEITPPSRVEHLWCDPNRSEELFFITLTKHRGDCLQLLELRDNCERAQMRVIPKPLCVVVMVVDKVPDGSCDVDARVEEVLDS